MAFPVYTVKELADFSNQEEDYYTDFAKTAISQASLLFRVATCLRDFPADPLMQELVNNAILAMAETIYETDKYKDKKFSPFSSEVIGSYSYTISLSKIKSGELTGVSWFDLAVEELGVCDLIAGEGAYSSGGIEVFEGDGTFVPGRFQGNSRILSPNDIDEFPRFSLDGN